MDNDKARLMRITSICSVPNPGPWCASAKMRHPLVWSRTEKVQCLGWNALGKPEIVEPTMSILVYGSKLKVLEWLAVLALARLHSWMIVQCPDFPQFQSSVQCAGGAHCRRGPVCVFHRPGSVGIFGGHMRRVMANMVVSHRSGIGRFNQVTSHFTIVAEYKSVNLPYAASGGEGDPSFNIVVCGELL